MLALLLGMGTPKVCGEPIRTKTLVSEDLAWRKLNCGMSSSVDERSSGTFCSSELLLLFCRLRRTDPEQLHVANIMKARES